jgi:hypothetical protein
MGTQIFQAATLMHLREIGEIAVADFSYFDRPPEIATVGVDGQLTHWHYQLDHFGLPMSSFKRMDAPEISKELGRSLSEIYSEFEVAQLGYLALRKPSISKRFPLSQEIEKYIHLESLRSSICLHIRRGDYVNVASHLTTLDEFFAAAKALSGLSNSLVVLSDSPVDDSTVNIFKYYYSQVYTFDNIPAEISHDMMRLARGIICSNSTFSLTAALLGGAQVVLLPKRWFAGKSAQLNDAIGQLSDWQLLKFE